MTLEFEVLDGVWRSDDETVIAEAIRGDQAQLYVNVQNDSAARGVLIVLSGTTTGDLVDPSITRHSRNLLYDSGFTAYSQSAGSFTPAVGEWRGNDALAVYARSPSAVGSQNAVQIRQSTRALAQRVHCVPLETYRFAAEVRLFSSGASATVKTRIRYRNGAGVAGWGCGIDRHSGRR